MVSSGTYKPQIHTHYLPHLSLSFARHTNSLNATFVLISSDYSKSLHLQVDRSLQFHTPQGCHHTTRIPRYGRDLAYDKRSAEALVPAVGVNRDGSGEVFRLNLELGRFMRAYEVDVGGDDPQSAGSGALQGGAGVGSVNVAAIAEESHNLLAFGTSLGTVELWDARSRNRAGILSLPAESQSKLEATALAFHRSGLTLASGTSTGLIYLYDLRSPVPLLKKDQGYDLPIQSLTFLTPSTSSRAQTSEPKMLSADKKIIKIWDTRDGAAWTSVEPAVDINHVAWCEDSGMILTANEGRQQHSFFIPQLGPAPKWCAFLDALVEEMAEDSNDPNAFKSGGEVYDNYKFVTTAQLKTLNLDHLVGRTNLLRPYMHGYFVAQRLYEEARLIADPFIWEEERAKRVREKIDKERESRIRGGVPKSKIKVKVNKELAERILARDEKRRGHRKKDEQPSDEEVDVGGKDVEMDDRPGLLKDSRFAALFHDEDFAVDQNSREYQMLNPSSTITTRSVVKDRTTVEDEEGEMAERGRSTSTTDQDESDSDDDDDDPLDHDKINEESASRRRQLNYSTKRKQPATAQKAKHVIPRMQVSTLKNTTTASRNQSFGSRLSKATEISCDLTNHGSITNPHAGGKSGEKGITFIPARRTRPRDSWTGTTAKKPSSNDDHGSDGDDDDGDRDRGLLSRAHNRHDQNRNTKTMERDDGSRRRRRDEGRRSASGNVLRGL